MIQRSAYDIIRSYMPPLLRSAMGNVEPAVQKRVNEVRLRVNRPLSFIFSEGAMFMRSDGSLSASPAVSNPVMITSEDVENVLRGVSRYSLHSCSKELAQGYFTIEKGIRVGIAGTMSGANEPVLKYISSLNFRVSRQVIGCGEQVCSQIFSSSSKSVVICGGVNTGKTTLLRDMCRICGDRFKVALIDERSEIAASVGGVPTNRIGAQTDVLDGYSRSAGVISSIRSLSPDMIFCDEISTEEDAEALLMGTGCGVKFVASVHAGSFNELLRRQVMKPLLNAGVFDYALIMEGKSFPGRVKEIRRLKGNG